jgi:hypothetical protein
MWHGEESGEMALLLVCNKCGNGKFCPSNNLPWHPVA